MTARLAAIAILLAVSLAGFVACPGGGQPNGDGGLNVSNIPSTGNGEGAGNNLVDDVGGAVNQATGNNGEANTDDPGTTAEEPTEVAWQSAPPSWTETLPSEPGQRIFAAGSAPLAADDANTPAAFDAADAAARAALQTAVTGLLAGLLGEDLAGCLAPEVEGGAAIGHAVTANVAAQCVTAQAVVRQMMQDDTGAQTVHSLVVIDYAALIPVLLTELQTAVQTFGGEVPPMPPMTDEGVQPPHPLAVQFADLQRTHMGDTPFDHAGAGIPAQ